MRKSYLLGAVMSFGLLSCSPTVDYADDGPKISETDLAVITGDDWVGTLTYTDYGSGNPTTIKSEVIVNKPASGKMAYKISYPDEPWEDSKEMLTYSSDGRLLDENVITARKNGPKGELIIVTAHNGEDNNAPALIHMTYGLDKTNFYIRKDVQFTPSQGFIQRNLYEFTR